MSVNVTKVTTPPRRSLVKLQASRVADGRVGTSRVGRVEELTGWLKLLIIIALALFAAFHVIRFMLNWFGECAHNFTSGIDDGYYGATRKELLAKGMPKEQVERQIVQERSEFSTKVDKAMPVLTPIIWIVLMVAFTLILIAFPISWPPLIYVWYRFCVAFKREFMSA